MKRLRVNIVLLTLILLAGCDAGINAILHFSGKVYYDLPANEQSESLLDKSHKDALNQLLAQVETAILSDRAEGLAGEELARFYNERRDIVVSFNRGSEGHYIYYADILDGSEHSKKYYSVPDETAVYIIEILSEL